MVEPSYDRTTATVEIMIDLNCALRTALRENTLCARLLSNGEIFLCVRTAHLRGVPKNKQIWMHRSPRDSREYVLILKRISRRMIYLECSVMPQTH